ncbi:MAG: type II toxin-antitoxin system death-on-curing family toxin [Ruminococcaceae bacterium]|nr:type II toxin-antitoxin system death-on-curing family toxin [Oscillospiraceae bacterium]
MKKLSKKQILMLHSQLIEETGGIDGVRDFNLLESAIENPFQVFAGEELYPTIQAKGVRLGYGLIKNHCMLDGNKRIGVHAMLVFFELNGIVLEYTQKELYEMVLAVADSRLNYEDMLRWVLEHQI